MKIGYELTTEQKAKLSMTPMLIQGIKILQMNNIELMDYIESELLENPVLEEKKQEEFSVEEPEGDFGIQEPDFSVEAQDDYYDLAEYRFEVGGWKNDSGRQEDYTGRFPSEEKNLQDFLLEQLGFLDLSRRERAIGIYIIEEIDDNGYLRISNDEISSITGATAGEVEAVLKHVRDMEPCGVGARSIEECLEMQLAAAGKLTEKISHIIEHMLEDVAANRITKIASKLSIRPAEAQAAIDMIKSLEPKPGRSFPGVDRDIGYVVPDLLLEKEDGEYTLSVNDSDIPALMISVYYKDLLANAKEDRNLNKYLSEKFNSAQWLIRNIRQRKETLFRVAREIVKFQRDFFDRGEEHLKSLTLRQVADSLNIHESTVSRAISGKYMQTPEGIFELKHFFPSRISSSNEVEGLSSSSVKFIIKDVINGENPVKPYSDREIVDLLKERGIDISRRTVAKYREEMGILSSSKRRRYGFA